MTLEELKAKARETGQYTNLPGNAPLYRFTPEELDTLITTTYEAGREADQGTSKTIAVWHRDGVVDVSGTPYADAQVYRNGKLADTAGKYEHMAITLDRPTP